MSDPCTNENKSCRYMEPHEHGFACDNTCTICAERREPLKARRGGKTTFMKGVQASAGTHNGALGMEAAIRHAADQEEAAERQRIREALRDPKLVEGIRGMQGMALELSQGAIRDQKVMEQWKEMFPDICPGCFGLHSRMIPYLKGLCTQCRMKVSKAQKQLLTQE